MQRQDPLLDKWRIAVIDQKLFRRTSKQRDITMRRQFIHLTLKSGVLYRSRHLEDEIVEQLIIPDSCRIEVLRGLHNDMGHPGRDRMLRLMRERYYWPGMFFDVAVWVDKCDRCIRRKSAPQRAPLVSITTTYPLEMVCFDFLTLEQSKGGYGNLLVITDHFTKFAVVVPTKNQTAKTTADAFFNNFIVNFGIPSRLHSDQGANFESAIIKELCNIMGIRKTHTTPYHPQGNAGPERMNRTLLSMLGTLDNAQKGDWKAFINPPCTRIQLYPA